MVTNIQIPFPGDVLHITDERNNTQHNITILSTSQMIVNSRTMMHMYWFVKTDKGYLDVYFLTINNDVKRTPECIQTGISLTTDVSIQEIGPSRDEYFILCRLYDCKAYAHMYPQ